MADLGITEMGRDRIIRSAYDAVGIITYFTAGEPEVRGWNLERGSNAVEAAGNWELDAAWKHVVALAEDPETDKDLLLAAIEAVGSIRPREAGPILVELTDSDDEEIAGAAKDAMMMADAASKSLDTFEEEDEDDEGTGKWVH